MELIARDGHIRTLTIQKKRGPNSKRSLIIKQIQELTGMNLKVLLFKHLRHIPGGEKGTNLLNLLYDIAITEDTDERKRIRFWQELKKTKV